MYCLDASVIVNAHLEKEIYHKRSKSFLKRIEEKNIKVFFPEIVIPEVASAILRATGNEDFSFEFIENLRNISNFSFVPVDSKLANLAGRIVCKTGLRGADSIYVALSFDYNLELVTLDKDRLKKSKGLIRVRLP